jgi:TP901 family phage tail tape measure protein
MAINMGSAIAYLELDTSKFSKGFTSAYNDLKVFGDKSATAGQKFKGFSSALNTVGSGLAKGVTLPLLGVGTAAVKVASSFDSAMSEVKAISGATGTQFTQLRDKAIEMGAKTKFSATESAEAFKYMAMAGWDTNDMLNSISGVMNLAAASGEDLGTVSDIVTDAMTAFGLAADGTTKVLKNGYNVEVSNAEHFSDVLAEASSRSNTNVSLMGATFKYVAPIAGAMGYSIEDTAVAIGLMANAGIKGEQAGTALRSTITRLVKPTKESGTAMDALGISVTNSDGSMKSLDDVLRQVRSSMSGLTEDQKASYAAMLAGQEGMSGLLAIVNASDEDYQKLSESIQNCTGASQEMADTMQDNLGGAVTLLKSALESAGITIGERLTPYIRELAEWITGLVEKFNNLSAEQQDQIVKWGLIFAAVGPILLVMSRLIGVVSGVMGAFTGLKGMLFGYDKIMKRGNFVLGETVEYVKHIPGLLETTGTSFMALIAPILAVVAVVAILVGAFVTLWKTNEEFRDNMVGIWNSIKESINNFFDGVVERINALGFDFENITEVIKTVWFALCDVLAPVFEGAFNTIAIVLDGVFNHILSVMDFFIGLFTGNWEQLVEGVKGVVSGIVETFANLGSNILGVIGDIGAEILNKLGFEKAAEGFQNFFDTLSDLFGQIPELLSSAIEWATTAIPEFINSVITFFQELPSKVWEWLVNTYNKVTEWGSNMIQKGIEVGSNFLQTVGEFFLQLPGRIWDFLAQTFQKVVAWGSQMVANGRAAITGFVSTVVGIITSLPSKVWDILSKIPAKVRQLGSQLRSVGRAAFNALWDGIKSVGDSILGWVSDFASSIKSFISGIVEGFNSVVGSANDAKTAAKSVNGKHANGLDYVPFNGYIAELHKGERVLTAQENKEYNEGRRGQGGDTFNFYNTKPEPYEYARQIKRAKKELLQGV